MPWRDVDGQPQYYTLPRKLLSNEVIEDLRSNRIVVTEGAPTIPGIGPEVLCSYALECLWAVLEGAADEAGGLPAEKYPKAIRAAGFDAAASPTLCSAFWAVWADIEGPKRDAFSVRHDADVLTVGLDELEAGKVVDVIQACRSDNLVSVDDLLEVLDVRLIYQVGLSQSQANPKVTFGNKLHNVHIQRAVKISQFNAFREEPEGFAKLLTLLHNSALAKLPDIESIDKEIMQLVGYFALSPLKVVYCILSAIESNPGNSKARALLAVVMLRPSLCTSSAILLGPHDAWSQARC
jgi:THO complex subunit 2 N-terminus